MKRFIEKAPAKTFDLIIVGGGITGASVAYDAASRGLSVALVEKGDFGGATSAATSKMIHGGLRYLANKEFRLVRESLRERRILENIAPNFVYPTPALISNGSRDVRIGMFIYDLLSFDKGWTWDEGKKMPCHKALSFSRVTALEPAIRKEAIRDSVVYHDGISIAPERLTLAFLKSAVRCGALVANYARVDGFLFSGSKNISGVRVTDLAENRTIDLTGRLVVNCCGPWADILLGKLKNEKTDKRARRSEGIHVITRKLVNHHIVSYITPAGKHVFLIPWRNHTLIGTTDREYIGDPDDFRVSGDAISTLLGDANLLLNDKNAIRHKDVLFAYGGLRPLLEDQVADVYHSSRKYEVYDHGANGLEGLITVEGGKYTTSRKLAENVMKIVETKLKCELGKCRTGSSYLAGCEIRDMERFVQRIIMENDDFEPKTVEFLGRNYGTEYGRVLDIARRDRSLANPLDDDGEIAAQALFAIRNEMALTLGDILFRRTGIGTLGHPGKEVLQTITDVAATSLKWDHARKKREIETVEERFILP
jgi:glycerol-3-phosphate dehydrogenase